MGVSGCGSEPLPVPEVFIQIMVILQLGQKYIWTNTKRMNRMFVLGTSL